MKKFLPLLCCLLFLLTGCVHYDVGINFDNQHHGVIVQHIKLGEQLTTLSEKDAQKWLNSIAKRTQKLQGKVKSVSPQEIIVTVPFNNGQELVTKFNKFFNPTEQLVEQIAEADALDVMELQSQMSLQQSNLLLMERNHLDLTVDLSPLGVISEEGNVIVSPGSLVELEFDLHTPWGVSKIISSEGIKPEIKKAEHQLIWQLQPGEVNHLEAIFWVPSNLGIGALVIALLMIAGFYVKYKQLPGQSGHSGSSA